MSKTWTRWTRETILAAIDDYVKRYGDLPAGEAWRKAKGTKNGRYPSKQTVSNHFGSWTNAMNTYRTLPTTNGSSLTIHPNSRPWTREEVITAFQAWSEAHQGPPTIKDAVATTGYLRVLPTASAVQRIFGSWNAGIEEAGFIPLAQGTTRKAVRKFMPLPRSR